MTLQIDHVKSYSVTQSYSQEYDDAMSMGMKVTMTKVL